MKTLRLILVILLGLFSVQVWGLDCSSANIHLDTQEDVDAFQTTFGSGGVCDTVTGYLTVKADDISNIDGLADLTNVVGGLVIDGNPVLTNVDGLARLTSVGRNLDINNNAALTNIDGLTKLASVGLNFGHWTLSIHNNAVLANIDGLASLTKTVGRLNIGRNPLLANLDGLANLTNAGLGLSIYGNEILTNIDGLMNLTSIDGGLSIWNNKALTNIDGLANLTSAGDVKIAHNTTLASVAGLAKLGDVWNWFQIFNNPALSNIDSLPNLNRVWRGLSIYNNNSLTGIDGLSALTNIGGAHLFDPGSLSIHDNRALTNIDGLSALSNVTGGLSIKNNDALANILGLASLKRVTEHLSIVNNAALTNVDALSRLTSVGSLSIVGNETLTNIDGLSYLTSIVGASLPIVTGPPLENGNLIITDNAVLSNITGLSNLISILDNLILSSNHSLASCAVLTALLDEIDDGEEGPGPGVAGIPDVGRSVTIKDNLEGCNGVDQILGVPLARPANLKATDGTFLNFVRVTFDPVEDATGYRVFRCFDKGDACGSPIAYPTIGKFDDKAVTPGTVYYYRVRSCIGNHCGKLGDADTGFANTPPARPTGISATKGIYPDRVTIRWNGPHSISIYRVFRCLDTGQSCGSPISFTRDKVFDDTKGDPGRVYYYRVKACNTQHCSEFSLVNPGYRSDTPAVEKEQSNALILPDQQVPIPSMNQWGRWLLMLSLVALGLIRVARQRV